jgi:spore coat polysaccharide biosynthesis protein SpsF (cytidylyltransferase family)
MNKENNLEVSVNVFVQARMSSQRFPGKVLAPLRETNFIACTGTDHARATKGENYRADQRTYLR